MCSAMAAEYSEVPPPAPYVTDMKSGLSAAILSTAATTPSKASPVFGGKTSKESTARLLLSMSEIFIAILYHTKSPLSTVLLPKRKRRNFRYTYALL